MTEGLFDDYLDGETEDDLAYIEFQRLRARGLSMESCRYHGYIASRVIRLSELHTEAFSRGYWDFTYLLERGAMDDSFHMQASYVAIDEINDLNPLQVKIVSKMHGDDVDQVGDLAQSIYGFAGVDPEIIRTLPHDTTRTLETSYRLTPPVAQAANAIIQKMHKPLISCIRTLKQGGEYVYERQIRNILGRIKQDPHAFGGVYVLARTNYLKSKAVTLAREYGLNVVLSDDDINFGLFKSMQRDRPPSIQKYMARGFLGPWLPARTYFKHGRKTALRRWVESEGEGFIPWRDFFNSYATDLLKQVLDGERQIVYASGVSTYDPENPAVRFDTIHKSKGMEDDTVIVLADKTERVDQSSSRDEEIRLAYVAVTRSKQRTYVSYLDGLNTESAYHLTNIKSSC